MNNHLYSSRITFQKIKERFGPPLSNQCELHESILKFQDHHNFYNSTFIGNQDFFKDYWANITINKAEVHQVLSNSHRRATVSITLTYG